MVNLTLQLRAYLFVVCSFQTCCYDRCRLSASPATGLVGMQENTFLSDFFGCVGFLPLTTQRYVAFAALQMVSAAGCVRVPCEFAWLFGNFELLRGLERPSLHFTVERWEIIERSLFSRNNNNEAARREYNLVQLTCLSIARPPDRPPLTHLPILSSVSNIRETMVKLMVTSSTSQQTGQGYNYAGPGTIRSASPDSPSCKIGGTADPSTCMFWCAVAMGAILKGSPVHSVSTSLGYFVAVRKPIVLLVIVRCV